MMDRETKDNSKRESGYTQATCCISCKYISNLVYGKSIGDCKKLSIGKYVDKEGLSWSGDFQVSYYGLCKFYEKREDII